MNQPNELPPGKKKKQEKIQAERSIILPAIASSSPKINATMAPVQIIHTLAIVHHPITARICAMDIALKCGRVIQRKEAHALF